MICSNTARANPQDKVTAPACLTSQSKVLNTLVCDKIYAGPQTTGPHKHPTPANTGLVSLWTFFLSVMWFSFRTSSMNPRSFDHDQQTKPAPTTHQLPVGPKSGRQLAGKREGLGLGEPIKTAVVEHKHSRPRHHGDF